MEYDPASERLSVIIPALVLDFKTFWFDGRIFSIYDVVLDSRLVPLATATSEIRVFFWPFGSLPLVEKDVASEFATTGDVVVWTPPSVEDPVIYLGQTQLGNRATAAVLSFEPVPRSVLFKDGTDGSLTSFNNYVRYANYSGVAVFDRSMPIARAPRSKLQWRAERQARSVGQHGIIRI